MTFSHRIEIADESQVGEARRYVFELAKSLGCDETFCGQVSIITTELARNIVRHAGRGEFITSVIKRADSNEFQFLALDQGAGMRSVVECMRDGFSTAGTAGTGLGSIQRLSSTFEIHSQAQKGTAVLACLSSAQKSNSHSTPHAAFQVGGVSVALEGEDLCGDAWTFEETAEGIRVLVCDGLGHGPLAAEASRECLNVFHKRVKSSLVEIIEFAHLAATKTRGAAASLAEIIPATKKVNSVAIGNVSMRLQYPSSSKNLPCLNGTLGASIYKIQPFYNTWEDDTLLIMHSDGLSTQWNLEDYPGLVRRHPTLIAGVLYRDFRRHRDDATVVVVRHRL